MKKWLRVYGTILVYTVAGALCIFAISGCALFQPCPVDGPAARMADDYRDAREDGAVDAGDMKMLDKDAQYIEEALDEKSAGFSLPSTGIGWLDGALAVGGMLVTAAGAHKYTMKKRDQTSPDRVKKALEKTA